MLGGLNGGGAHALRSGRHPRAVRGLRARLAAEVDASLRNGPRKALAVRWFEL